MPTHRPYTPGETVSVEVREAVTPGLALILNAADVVLVTAGLVDFTSTL